MRLAPLLLLLPLTACIERTPTADDDPPLECAPADCGRSPDIVRCPDDTPRASRCVPNEGVCQWAIARCAEPEPEPAPEPGPIVECAPDACGPRDDSPQCPAGSEAQYECVAGVDACGWQVSCEPVDPPQCAGACGVPPAGEPCGPNERSVQECRAMGDRCDWYIACEPIECAPDDCPADPPRPNCEHTMECVPMAGACDWEFECIMPVCEQPWDAGSCRALQPMWWFNSATAECELRDYGGCEGNDNRFETEEECYGTCGVLGGEPGDPGAAACVPTGDPWFVRYDPQACLPDMPDGDSLLIPELTLLPGDGCSVAQLAGDGADHQRSMTPEGHATIQAQLDALQGIVIAPQDPDCDALTRLDLVLEGETVEYRIDRDDPPAELDALLEVMREMRAAMASCDAHPFLAACP